MSDNEEGQKLVLTNKKCRVESSASVPSPTTAVAAPVLHSSASKVEEQRLNPPSKPFATTARDSSTPESESDDDETAGVEDFQPLTGRRRRTGASSKGNEAVEKPGTEGDDGNGTSGGSSPVPVAPVEGDKVGRLRTMTENDSSVKESPGSCRQSEQDSPLEQSVVGEKDYLEFRAVTKRIKDILVESIGGPEGSEFRQTVASQITRGRCSFTKSAQPPESILRDNPQLKEYQVAAVHWLLTLFKNGLNGLVADDMGLGKSAECICFLKRLCADGLMDLPTVVACPATLLDNWCFEFKKWAPEMKVIKYHGSQNERKMLMRQFETGLEALEDDDEEDDEYETAEEATGTDEGDSTAEDDHTSPAADPSSAETDAESPPLVQTHYPLPADCAYHILVTTHQTLANRIYRQQFFKQHNFGFLVVDEAHSLKNSASLRYQQMNRNVNAPNRLLLTGSPVQNQISELKNLLTFLNPYRKCSFDINDALTYHTAVWKQAVDRGNRQKSQPNGISDGGSDQVSMENDQSNECGLVKNHDIGSMSVKEPGTIVSGEGIQSTVNNEKSMKLEENNSPASILSSMEGEKQQTDPEILFYQQLLAPLILRRLKTEVIDNFPRKTNKIQLCDMLPIQQKLYDAEIRAARPLLAGVSSGLAGLNGRKRGAGRRAAAAKKDGGAIANGLTMTAGRRGASASAQSAGSVTAETVCESPSVFIKGLLFRLRRICNHPLLYQHYFNKEERLEFANFLKNELDEFKQFSLERILQHISDWSDYDLHMVATANQPKLKKFEIPPEEFLKSCKIKQMLELVDQLCSQKDEKVLIFSQFTSFLNVIGDVLSIHRPQFKFLRLDGSTKVYERSSMVSAFQSKESEFKIFLLSTKAGGVGLNLTSANTVLLMDQDWNPHNDRQAEDRVHRLGQTEDVTVYRICCRHSFEETVLSCCKKKLELDEAFGGAAEALPLEIFEDIIRTVKVTPPDDDNPDSGSNNTSPAIGGAQDSDAASTTPTPNEPVDNTSPLPNDDVSGLTVAENNDSSADLPCEDQTKNLSKSTTRPKRTVASTGKRVRNSSKKSATTASSNKDRTTAEPAPKKRAISSGNNSSCIDKGKGNQNLAPAAQRLGSSTNNGWQEVIQNNGNNNRNGASGSNSSRQIGRKKGHSGQQPLSSVAGRQMLLPGCESDDEENNGRMMNGEQNCGSNNSTAPYME